MPIPPNARSNSSPSLESSPDSLLSIKPCIPTLCLSGLSSPISTSAPSPCFCPSTFSGTSILTSPSNHPGATRLFSARSSFLLLSSQSCSVDLALDSRVWRCDWRDRQEARIWSGAAVWPVAERMYAGCWGCCCCCWEDWVGGAVWLLVGGCESMLGGSVEGSCL